MNSAKIMIVEDEIIVARDVQARLEKAGYEAPVIATTGDDAVRLARESRPDLILMDIILRRGFMDGFSTVEKIREHRDVPVVYLTGRGDDASLRKARVTKPYGYVLKPFQTRELVMAVEIALSRHELERQLQESNRWLSTTLASIGEGVVATDRSGKIRFANSIAASLLECPPDEIAGRDIDSYLRLFSSSTREALPSPHHLLERTQDRIVSLTDVVLRTAAGNEKPLDVTVASLDTSHNDNRSFVCVFRDITERKMAEEYIRNLAYHDALTGLPNRTLLFDRIQKAMVQCQRHGRNMAVLFLDLDDFKIVNDTLGHAAGDALLKDLAARLQDSIRTDDLVARLAGDEFIIILNDVATLMDIEQVAAKIVSRLEESFTVGGSEVTVTASIGISIFPMHSYEMDDLIRYADTAMYLAKQRGKSDYVIYNADWKTQLPAQLKGVEDAKAG